MIEYTNLRGDNMIILSSDYDGTLKTRIHDLRINIREIHKYRELGNIFVLNTGRPYGSIRKEIKRFDIPFDYLCCNDGAVIFDEHLDVVKETTLKPNQVRHIKNLVPYFYGFKIDHFYTAKEVSNKEVEGPIEIEIIKPDGAKFDALTSLITETVSETEYFAWKNSLYVKSNVSKSKALEEIARIIDPMINPASIYTIGDEANDLEMIKNHHGFRMLESSPKLWFTTWRIVPEVHHLVKYLNFKSKRTK